MLGGCNAKRKVKQFLPKKAPPPELDVAKVQETHNQGLQQGIPHQKRALAIKHGWDIPIARVLPQMAQEVSESPFDGIVFSGEQASRTFSGRDIPTADIRKSLAPLDKIPKEHPFEKFIILYVDSIEGGFNGPNLNTMIKNVEEMAKVAASKNIKGIAFDNEVYRGDPWTMPASCPGLDRKACGKAAFEAGKKMMRAVVKHWPDVIFLSFFGPWLHDPRTYTWINQYAPQNDWSDSKDVSGDFLAGVFAATQGNAATFVDGGEIYGLRTRKDFNRTALWMRDIMVKESPFFPDDLREAYSKEMKVGFGIYDDRKHLFSQFPRLTPGSWKAVIQNALQESDLVWIYTERHDWWKSDGKNWPVSGSKGSDGPVNSVWMEAARQALAK